MIRLSENLEAFNVKTELYQGGMKKSLEFMKNVYAAHRETAREVGLDD